MGELMTATGADLGQRAAAAAERYVGTPWRHQGRRPGAGLDCIGLVAAAYASAGLDVRDDRTYGHPCRPGILRRALVEHFGAPRADRRVGDVVLLWIREPRWEIHCGIVVSASTMVHALERQRASFASLDGHWGRAIAAVFGMR